MLGRHCAAQKWVNGCDGSQKFLRRLAPEVPEHHKNIAGTVRDPRKWVPEVIRIHKNMTGTVRNPKQNLPGAV